MVSLSPVLSRGLFSSYDFLVDFVVRGYHYGDVFGDFVPFIDVFGLNGSSCFLLWDRHSFVFRGRFCRWCGSFLDGFSRLGLCGGCYYSARGVRYRLIVEGYDVFDYSVVLEHSDLVFRDYVLYLGVFGDLVKVGISSFNRGGVVNGFVDRLLEQGFDHAVVIDGGFDLVSAQDLERDVSREFGLVTALSFRDKLDHIYSKGDFSLSDLVLLGEEVVRFIGSGRIIWSGSFNWCVPPDFDGVWSGDFLIGDFFFARGNLVFVDDGSERLVVNLSDLVGRGIVSWEV